MKETQVFLRQDISKANQFQILHFQILKMTLCFKNIIGNLNGVLFLWPGQTFTEKSVYEGVATGQQLCVLR